MTLTHDSIERDESELALARYRLLSEYARDIMLFTRTDGRIVEANRAAVEAYGYSREELLGLSVFQLRAPEEGPLVASQLAEAGAGGVGFETLHHRKDGTVFPVEVNSQSAEIGGERLLFSVIRDASERRRTEQTLRETEARLQQAQRVQSVGRLAGGIAHEVNNLMTVVLGFGTFALDQLDPRHPARAEIEQVIRAGERAAAITRQLLAFTRQQVLRPARLDINAVVGELVPMLERVLGAEHRLTLRLGAGLAAVAVDRGQLEQVLINLVLNSRDAMPVPGTVTIATEAAELDEQAGWHHPGVELRRGWYLRLTVDDTGTGMDEPTRSRVFEPFFTTKPVGQGTGLGLSTVYGIVKQSGGYVWLYSEPGLGTSVKVYLPSLEAAGTADGSTAASPEAEPARGELILVAEDEELVRSLARRSLELHGYRVLEAADGRAALELLERMGGVDLVVSDAVMPLVSGRALGEIVAARWPGLPVLYISGYPGREVVDRGLVNPEAPFLGKPFTPETLARRVREILDQVRR